LRPPLRLSAAPPSAAPGLDDLTRQSYRLPLAVGIRRSKWSKGRQRRQVDLRKALFVLPNALTLASIFCGFNAITLCARDGATDADFYRAAILLIFAMFFDLIDGRVARLTKTQSAFGLQIDSLADVISFGVAPALLMYRWVLHQYGALGLLTAFSFVACGAIRLARFNVLSSSPGGSPTKPGKYIVGLPIPPASAGLISLVVANHASGGVLSEPRWAAVLMVITVVLGLLMVSTVQFRSFKELKLDSGTVLLVLFVIGSSVYVGQRWQPQFVLAWLLGIYVMVGFFETLRAMLQRAVAQLSPPRDSVPPAE
jgi:CDP-diacylglycerol---serine O-phosphatidyltransferase